MSTRLNTKLTAAEMDKINEAAFSILGVAGAIHREHHQPSVNSSKLCPFFPCNLANDVLAEISHEYKRQSESE